MRTAQTGHSGAISSLTSHGAVVKKCEECVPVPVAPSSALRPESGRARRPPRRGERKKALKKDRIMLYVKYIELFNFTRESDISFLLVNIFRARPY